MEPVTPISEIWSGGQTGVDRAAFDAALDAGVPIRGWIPLGRAAEDAGVPERYEGLVETETDNVVVRTERNVRDSDATLILTFGAPSGGTELTRRLAVAYERPVLVIDLAVTSVALAGALAAEWCAGLPAPVRLNVAGPRASKAPEVYALARAVVATLLRNR
jgi:Circularly permutated YpsA SLOG family